MRGRTLHARFELFRHLYDSLCSQSEAPDVGTMQRRDLERALGWFEHKTSAENVEWIEATMAVVREARRIEVERLKVEAEARRRFLQKKEEKERQVRERKEKKRAERLENQRKAK